MAMTGFGLRFAVEDALGSGNYTDLAELLDLTPPGSKLDAPEATTHASPGASREFTGGLIDPGEAMATLAWAPGSASDLMLRAWLSARARRGCLIVYANQAAFGFVAFPTSWAPAGITPGGLMRAAVTLKVTGDPAAYMARLVDETGQSLLTEDGRFIVTA